MPVRPPKDVRIINQQLLDKFGREALGDRPLFRLVWSDDQMEYRRGHFEDWYAGTIFLREYDGIRHARKYNYLHQQWVLEKLVYEPNRELPESENGHYEILWAFPKDLPPLLKACLYAIYRHINKVKKTIGWYKEQDELDKLADRNLILDMWEEDSSYLASMVHSGEGVFVPGTYMKPGEIEQKIDAAHSIIHKPDGGEAYVAKKEVTPNG